MILQFKGYFTNIMKKLPPCVDYIRYKFLESNDEAYISFHYIDPDDDSWPHICTVNLKNDSKQQGVCEPTILGEVWTTHFEHIIVCYLNPFFFKSVVNKIKENYIASEVEHVKKGMQSLVVLALQEAGKSVLVQKEELPTGLIEEAQILNLFQILKPYLVIPSFYMTL